MKDTWALGHSKSSWHLGAQNTWVLRQLGTRALKGHLRAWALEKHLGLERSKHLET